MHGQASRGHYQANSSVWKDLKFLLQIPLGMNFQTNIITSEHPGALAPSLQNVAPWTEELHQLYLQISHMEKKKGSFSAAATPLWKKAQSWQTWHLVNSRRAALGGGGLNSSVSVISWAWEKVLELLKSIMGIKKSNQVREFSIAQDKLHSWVVWRWKWVQSRSANAALVAGRNSYTYCPSFPKPAKF